MFLSSRVWKGVHIFVKDLQSWIDKYHSFTDKGCISGGFRGVLRVSTEPHFGLDLMLRGTGDRLDETPLSG